jgi:hypothetical protein
VPIVLKPHDFGLFPAGDVESAASVSVSEAMSRPREAVA